MDKLNGRQRFFLYFPLVLGIIALLYRTFNPLEHALFPNCPIKTITGLDCPGCGAQRAAHYLLNGEIQLALVQNSFVFIIAPYLLLGFYLQLVPEPKTWETRLKKTLYNQKAIIGLGIIALIYTILKNTL